MRTRGEVEAAVSDGITRFEQEYMGRGPKHIRTHLLGDLLVVRLQGVLTAAEQQLARSVSPEKGRVQLEQVRIERIALRGFTPLAPGVPLPPPESVCSTPTPTRPRPGRDRRPGA